MNERAKYIEQLKEENRNLWGELEGLDRLSDGWKRIRREIKANDTEIEIIEAIIHQSTEEGCALISNGETDGR